MQKLPLTAAGGNSSAARRARAALQWRDRFGRWVEMGRGIKFKMRLGTGATVSVNGKFVGASDKPGFGQVYVTKDPNGIKDGFYEVKSSNGQEILASLDPSDLQKQGIEVGKDANGSPVGERTDADIQDEATITRLDAPLGWDKLDETRFKTDDGEFAVLIDPQGRPAMWHNDQKPRRFEDWPSLLEEVDKVDAGESDWDAAYEREQADSQAENNEKNAAQKAAYQPTDQEKAEAKRLVKPWDADGAIAARIDAGAKTDEVHQLLDANIAFRAAKDDYDSRLTETNRTSADQSRWDKFEPVTRAVGRLNGKNVMPLGRPSQESAPEAPVEPETPEVPEAEAPETRTDALGDPIPSTPEELQKRLAYLERRVDRADPEDPNFDKIYEARDQIKAELDTPATDAAPEAAPEAPEVPEEAAPEPEAPAAPEPEAPEAPAEPEAAPEGETDALGEPIPTDPEALQKRLAYLERRIDRSDPSADDFDKIYEARDQVKAKLDGPEAAPEAPEEPEAPATPDEPEIPAEATPEADAPLDIERDPEWQAYVDSLEQETAAPEGETEPIPEVDALIERDPEWQAYVDALDAESAAPETEPEAAPAPEADAPEVAEGFDNATPDADPDEPLVLQTPSEEPEVETDAAVDVNDAEIDRLQRTLAGKDLGERAPEIEEALDNEAITAEEISTLDKELAQAPDSPNTVTRPRPDAPASNVNADEAAAERDPAYESSGNHIMDTVRDQYPGARELSNGDLVVGSREFEGQRFDVIVRRTNREQFFVYYQETTLESGESRLFRPKEETHSYTALQGHINYLMPHLDKKRPGYILNRNKDSLEFPDADANGERLLARDTMNPNRESHVSRGGVALTPGDIVDWTDWRETRPALDQFGKKQYKTDQFGNVVRKRDGKAILLTEPNPTYGMVFRGTVMHLQDKDNGHRDQKGKYVYSDRLWVKLPEYNRLQGYKESQQRDIVSSNVQRVEGPDAPATPAFFSKKEELAERQGVDRPVDAEAFGVPTTPRGAAAVTIPRPAASEPVPLTAESEAALPATPTELPGLLERMRELGPDFIDGHMIKAGDIIALDDVNLEGDPAVVVASNKSGSWTTELSIVRPSGADWEASTIVVENYSAIAVYRVDPELAFAEPSTAPDLAPDDANGIQPVTVDEINAWAEEIRNRYASGVREILHRATAGAMNNRAEIVYLGDGSEAFIKEPLEQESVDKEVLANQLAHAIGLHDINLTEIEDGKALAMTVAPGSMAYEMPPADWDTAIAHPNGRKIGLLDYLTNNYDRNEYNWFIDDSGAPIAIDHGEAWSADQQADSVFLEPAIGSDYKVIPGSIGFNRRELEQLNANLDILRPLFEIRGRLAWFNISKIRLAKLLRMVL